MDETQKYLLLSYYFWGAGLLRLQGPNAVESFLSGVGVLGRPNHHGKSSLVHPRGTREDQAIVCQHPGWALDYTVTMI